MVEDRGEKVILELFNNSEVSQQDEVKSENLCNSHNKINEK